MTTEELKVKISVDTSDVSSKVAEAKKKLGGIAEANEKNTGSTKNTTAAMSDLKDTMDKIRNLQFADLIIGNLDKATTHIHKAKNEFSAFSELMKDSGILFASGFAWTDVLEDGAEGSIKEKLKSIKIGVKEALTSMSAGFQNAGRALGHLGSAITSVFSTTMITIAGVVAAVGALVVSIKNAINVSKQLKQELSEAKKIGLDLATYQEWGYILESVGVEADKLSDFLKTLADEQNAVREGSEDIIAAFGKLGLTAEQVGSMTQGELFEKTVSGLQNIENEVERTSIAYKIFGEDAANLTSLVAMNNQQLKDLTNNFYYLGGVASDSLIDKSTALQYSIQNMSTAWQGLKNTLAEAIMPVINTVVNGLTKAIAIVNMFIRAVFGYDIVSKSTKKVNSAASGIGGYTSSVKDATAAVEKLKRTTMGFDELNIVSAPTSGGSGSGSGGSGSGSGGSFSAGLGDLASGIENLGLEKWAAKIEKFKNSIRLLTPVVMVAIGLVGCIACLITGHFVGAVAFGAMAGLGIALGVGNGAWADIGQGIKDWWNNTMVPWWKEGPGKVFTKEFWTEKWEKIKTAAKEKLEALKTTINEKWTAIKEWFKTNVAPKFTKEYWKTKFDNLKQGASDKLQETKQKISDKWTEIKNWFKTNVGKYFTKEYWTNKFDSIRSGAATLKEKITGVFKGVGEKVGDAVSGAVKGAINGIFTIIENKVNSFINMINGAITNINKIPGVNIKTLSKISIPRLATGGITTGSVLANIGENGREAVLPLEHNTGWMDTLADRIAAKNSAPSKIVLTVDGRELGWASINGINGITKQTGGLQLQII